MVFYGFPMGFPMGFPSSPQPPQVELSASGTAQGGFAVPLATLLRAGATGPGVELAKNGGSGWCWYILMVNGK